MNSAPYKVRLPDELLAIGKAVAAAGGRPVLVGGWVRDQLLGASGSKDFDLEVFALEAGKLPRVLARFGSVHMVGRRFGVLHLVTRDAEYDISLPRRENKTGRGHKHFQVATDPEMSFAEAAARRDFTINALGYAFLEDRLLDPHGGQRDLKGRLLRHVGPAFGEDPLRVLRAMQFAGRFGLAIAPETLQICREQDLTELPRERIWEEFKKLLLRSPAPSAGLGQAEPLGLLPYYPELEALGCAGNTNAGGRWELTLAVLDEAARLRERAQALVPQGALVLMIAALCQRFGEQNPASRVHAARTFLERLTNEGALIDSALALLEAQDLPGALYEERGSDPQGAIRRLSLRVRIPLLELLARARHGVRSQGAAALLDTSSDVCLAYPAGEWLLARAAALGVLQGPPPPLLKGRHLQALGFSAGKAMGNVLREAYRLQLEGNLCAEEEARHWAAAQMRRLGMTPEEER